MGSAQRLYVLDNFFSRPGLPVGAIVAECIPYINNCKKDVRIEEYPPRTTRGDNRFHRTFHDDNTGYPDLGGDIQSSEEDPSQTAGASS